MQFGMKSKDLKCLWSFTCVDKVLNNVLPIATLIFGYVILNDWSARDIQAWEYQPLGPFQAKATATTISPWIVTKAALEPFRRFTQKREKPLLKYLEEKGPMLYDINLSVSIETNNTNQPFWNFISNSVNYQS